MTISRVLIGGCLAITVAGCATPMELSQKDPLIEFHSDKNARAFTACVSKVWADTGYTLSTVLLEDGYMTSLLAPYTGSDATATVKDVEVGSYVTYAERVPSLSPAWMSDAVKDCK